jgi:hypothetical protein
MKKSKRRFALDRQTISTLTPKRLEVVAGGNADTGRTCGTCRCPVTTSAWQCPSLIFSDCATCVTCDPPPKTG